MPDPVTLRDSEGRAYGIAPEDVNAYIAQGFTPESGEQNLNRIGADVRSDIYGGTLGKIGAFGAGALSTATLGLSDVAGEALGAGHTLKSLREENPYATLGGELVGGLAPVGPAHALTGVGRAIMEAGEGAGVAAKIGRGVAAGAVEGAGFGGGQYLTQVALEDKPLSAEGFVGAMGTGALFGAPIGGVMTAGEAALLKARSLFPRSQVTTEAARSVKQGAQDALSQSLADGEQMARAAERRIAITENKVGSAQAAEEGTRRMFGDAHPVTLDAQVAGNVEGQQVRDALQKYNASRAQLADWIRNEADPELEAALTGLVGPAIEPGVASRAVPIEEFGTPGQRGYDPFKRPMTAEGTPVAKAPQPATAAFDSKDLGLTFDPETRNYFAQADDATPAAPVGLPSDTLTGQLRLMQSQLGKGADLSALGAPSRAEYAASKAAKTKEAAEHFRAKANEKNNAGSAIAEETGQRTAPLEVRPVGRPSERKFEAKMPDGSTRVLNGRNEVSDLLGANMPPGFSEGGLLETHLPFSIRQGIPGSQSEIADNAIYVVRPSEIADRGILGNKIRPDDLERGAKGLADASVKLPPVEIDMAPDGEMWIRDGNHRVLNAAKTDRPMAVKFHKVAGNRAEETAAGRASARGADPDIDASVRIREALPRKLTVEGSAHPTKTGREFDDFFANLTRPKTERAYIDQNLPRAWKEEGSYAAAHAKLKREWAEMRRHPSEPANHDLTRVLGEDEALKGLRFDPKTKSLQITGPESGYVVGESNAKLADLLAGDQDHVTTVRKAPVLPAGSGPRKATLNSLEDFEKFFGKAPEERFNPKTNPDSYLPTKMRESLDKTLIDSTLAPEMEEISINHKIEQALAKHNGKNKNIGPDLASAAKAIGDWEAASADLVEILGPEAPASAVAQAKAYRAAVGAHADAAGSSMAKATADIDGKLSPAIAQATGGKTAGALGAVADVGTALEVLKAMGVHTPALSAIPVIGPILGLFFKARAVMGILGRKGGGIGRSTEGIVAAKSAATIDRINAATVQLLEASAKGMRKAAAFSASPAVTLGTALFPGGEKTSSKDPRDLYHARMDELARALQPGAIAHAIGDRVQTSDPTLQDAVTAQVERGMKFLDSKALKQTVLPGMIPGDGKWEPSKAAIEEWGKYVHAVNDPASVLEDLAKGHISMEGAETLRVVYPLLFAHAQRILLEKAPEMQKTLPYSKRVAISIMYQIPVDGTMTPRPATQPSPMQGAQVPPGQAPPQSGPALTAPLQSTSNMSTSLDRRAGA